MLNSESGEAIFLGDVSDNRDEENVNVEDCEGSHRIDDKLAEDITKRLGQVPFRPGSVRFRSFLYNTLPPVCFRSL